jgi:alpha-aminoadipate/glutamate carrier protein LysW
MAICPECEFEIDIDEYDVDRGDTLECDNCGVTLEIIGLNPIEFEVASDDEEEEDKDEDDDELDTDENETDEDDDE